MNHSSISLKQQPRNFLKKSSLIALMLLLLSVVLRFPFFFPDIIHWDESTFILMGQSILDGQLPYLNIWDIKPPLAFVFYAVFILLLGKSIISIRLAGAICIAIVGWLTYFVGKTVWSERLGILAGVALVIIASVIDYSFPVMTEHIALVPLMAALCILVSRKLTPSTLFFVGILLATASLIRLNLAYVSVIVGLFLIFQKPIYSVSYFFWRGIAYACGNLLVILLTFIPYLVIGEQQIWWSSVVIAPWMYAHFQPAQSNLDKLAVNLGTVLLLVGGLIGIKLLTKRWRKILPHQQTPIVILMMFFITTEISILRSGGAADHYTIQVFPFFALLVAWLLNLCLFKIRLKFIVVVSLVLAILLSPIFPQYKTIMARAMAGKSLTYGSSYDVANYLQQANPKREPVYLAVDHLAYWFMDLQPISKSTTHPSNIRREYLFDVIAPNSTSSKMEMVRVLSQKPKFVVKVPELWYFSKEPETAAVLESVLAEQYELIREIGDRQIYRRLS